MELIRFLDKLALTRYEREAVQYLATVKQATAQATRTHTSIPDGRIYSVLNSLKAKGIVTLFPVSPKQYKIDHVKDALHHYVFTQQAVLKARHAQIDALELRPQKEVLAKNPASIALYKGRKEHLAAVASLTNRAQRTILQLAPLFVGTHATRFALFRALKRNVNIKIIVENVTAKNKSHIKACLAHGAQIRKLNDPRNFGLSIQDGCELLLSVQDRSNQEERMVLYTRNLALLKNLKNTFYTLWKQAKPITKAMLR